MPGEPPMDASRVAPPHWLGVRNAVAEVLGIDPAGLGLETPLLGHVPQFDSMAVVAILAALEDRFDLSIDYDDLTADVFASLETLVRFVEQQATA